jgi:hypothetical protein
MMDFVGDINEKRRTHKEEEEKFAHRLGQQILEHFTTQYELAICP